MVIICRTKNAMFRDIIIIIIIIIIINLTVAPCIFVESFQFINQRMHI